MLAVKYEKFPQRFCIYILNRSRRLIKLKTYVQRINEETPTRIWVNNPLPSEAVLGRDAGVWGATSNPTYMARMLRSDETKAEAISAIDRHVRAVKDDHLVVSLSYQDMIKKISDVFLPVFEQTQGKQGWVAIQGNPYHDDEVDFVVDEALRLFSIAPNIVVKLSATTAGISAMEKLSSEGRCALATAGVSNYYAQKMFEAYDRGAQIAGGAPTQYVTTLAAPFEGYAKAYVAANNVDIAPELVEQSGIAMSKHMYKIWKEKYSHINCRLMGGGVRAVRHFTEMVGGDLHVTCNWEFIKQMIEMDLPVEERINHTISEAEFAELCEKIPAFKQAYEADGLLSADLDVFPPFELFRNNFTTAWDTVLSVVRERRILLDK